MGDLRDLYQEVILDHNRQPRNFGKLEGACKRAEGFNPLCGDHLNVYVLLEGDNVKAISFQGSGCAISKASASMMTQSVKGKTKQEALALFDQFRDLVTREVEAKDKGIGLGKLAVFAGVSEFPVRVKCATLAWHTFRAALEDKSEPVSTE